MFDSKRKKIAIFGGSFDPPHLYHQLIIINLLKLQYIDMIYVIPCGNHPLKKNYSSFKNRFNMCKIAFKSISSFNNINISDIEYKLNQPSFTYNTIKRIKQKFKNKDIVLAIGSDLIPNLNKWYKIIITY